jgi:hypothetical protein
MSATILILWMALFFSSGSPSPVRRFSPVPISRFPQAVFLRDFCEGESLEECWAFFRDHGRVWAANIDEEYGDVLLVKPSGGWRGAAGEWYFLYGKQGNEWTSLEKGKEEDGWQTWHPRFDVLPILRSGHHDLRVAVDGCLKWDGAKYVWYKPEDYHQLSSAWFNARDNNEAEIFWAIRYAGQGTISFEPQWFPLAKGDFLTLEGRPRGRVTVIDPRVVGETLDDPQEHVRWVGLIKGGVWGIRGDRAFLLAPQLSETFDGIGSLRFDGDWLLAYGTMVDVEKNVSDVERSIGQVRPSIRYNRRSHELHIERHDWEPPD